MPGKSDFWDLGRERWKESEERRDLASKERVCKIKIDKTIITNYTVPLGVLCTLPFRGQDHIELNSLCEEWHCTRDCTGRVPARRHAPACVQCFNRIAAASSYNATVRRHHFRICSLLCSKPKCLTE